MKVIKDWIMITMRRMNEIRKKRKELGTRQVVHYSDPVLFRDHPCDKGNTLFKPSKDLTYKCCTMNKSMVTCKACLELI